MKLPKFRNSSLVFYTPSSALDCWMLLVVIW